MNTSKLQDAEFDQENEEEAGVPADVNAKDRWGMTPLHYPAAKGHKEIVELIIAKGADVNAKNRVSNTPLHKAAFYGRKEIVQLLIYAGADVNAKDDHVNYGRTPLDAARRHPKVADILRKHGGKTGEELKAEGK